MGWVLNFQILITYVDDSNFIQIDYQLNLKTLNMFMTHIVILDVWFRRHN
jgi:hypothetical protein